MASRSLDILNSLIHRIDLEDLLILYECLKNGAIFNLDDLVIINAVKTTNGKDPPKMMDLLCSNNHCTVHRTPAILNHVNLLQNSRLPK